MVMQQAGLPRERAGHRDLALLDRQPHHPARDRGDEAGLRQVVPGLLQAGPRLLELRAGRLVGRPRPRRRPSCACSAASGAMRFGPSWLSSSRAVPGPLGLVAVGPRLEQGGLGGGDARPRARDTAAWYCAGSIWMQELALAAPGRPPRTAIRMMRPVMSAVMSTEVLRLDLPARGDRADQVASASPAPSGPRCRRSSSCSCCRRSPPPAGQRQDPDDQTDLHPTRHVRSSLAKGTPDRRFQRGDGLVVIVDRVHVVALGLLDGVLRVGHLERGARARAGSGPAPAGAGPARPRGWPPGRRSPGRRSAAPR